MVFTMFEFLFFNSRLSENLTAKELAMQEVDFKQFFDDIDEDLYEIIAEEDLRLPPWL